MADLPAGLSAVVGRQALRRRMYYIYILKSIKVNFFYKGITNNIERRLEQHSRGQVVTTKSKLPIGLLFVQICANRQEARLLEKYFKSGSGREIIREIDELIGPVAEWQTLRS